MQRIGAFIALVESYISYLYITLSVCRPDTSGIMLHPYFWSAAKRMNFLQDVSDHLENLRQKPASPILEELERSAHRVIGTDWSLYLDQCFVDIHRKRIEYNVESVQDLLRTIRNNVCSLSRIAFSFCSNLVATYRNIIITSFQPI